MALGLLLIRFDFFYRKVLKKRSFFRKVVTWTVITLTITILGLYKLIRTSNDPMAITKDFIYIEPFNSFFRKDFENLSQDWNDYELMERERKAIGFGEHGLKVYLTDPVSPQDAQMIIETGHNTAASDKISLSRSVPDYRSVECKKALFRKNLPKVSIIIPFFNEHITTLLRSVYSVINRSPGELLLEVILVDDGSSYPDLTDSLENHFKDKTWGRKVKILKMNQRSGIIGSRLAGARFASGDVLLFLDCHVEAGYNYLPPLLDPIVDNYRAVVVPTLDTIDKETYEIKPLGEGRTVFDWNFHPQRIPVHFDATNRSKIFKTPIMFGSAFAISAKYYWELQPDSSLVIYGGDQFEMSFKINLCGGVLYENPCSRIAHLYRRFPYKKHQKDIDYKARNNKRVAEIWLDEYKVFLYQRHYERYANLDVGDISKQVALKAKLKCKPFKYFIERIAPDMLERFPLFDLPYFATGTIRNLAHDKCIQASDRGHTSRLILATCSHNKTNPIHQQHFTLRHYRDIQIHGKSDCLEGSAYGLTFARCHYEQGNQYFRYDPVIMHLFWGGKRNNMCLDVRNTTLEVVIKFCEEDKLSQKWTWGHAKVESLSNWMTEGAAILDKDEIHELEVNEHHIVEECQEGNDEEVKEVEAEEIPKVVVKEEKIVKVVKKAAEVVEPKKKQT